MSALHGRKRRVNAPPGLCSLAGGALVGEWVRSNRDGQLSDPAHGVCHASGMGWKEFAASIFATTLSWPVAFIVVVLIFHKPLKHLIGRVRSGKVAGVEFEVREELREADSAARKAEQLAYSVEPASTPASSPTRGDHPTGSENSTEAPGLPNFLTAAFENDVISSELAAADRIENAHDRMYFIWGRLEQSLRRLYGYAVVGDMPDFLPVDRAAEILSRGDILDKEFVDSIAALRGVLEDVNSTGYASHSTARKFTRTAARLRGIVERQNAFYSHAANSRRR